MMRNRTTPLTWVFGLYVLMCITFSCVDFVLQTIQVPGFCVYQTYVFTRKIYLECFSLPFVQEAMIVIHRITDYPELEGTQGSNPDCTWGNLKVKPNV